MQLDNWLERHHLDPVAQAAYAAAFAEVPYASVIIDNFLKAEKLAALQRVFKLEGVFEGRYTLWGTAAGTYGAEEVVTAKAWHAADERQRASVELSLVSPKPEFRLGRGVITQALFFEMLRSAAFMDFLSSVTGIRPETVTNIQTRIMVSGQYVRTHSDRVPGRDLCAVFYV